MPNGLEKCVALDGVFTQAGGTAIESKDQLLRCIDDAVQLLQSLREYAQENDSGVDISDVPAVPSVAELEGMLQAIMSDQAAAATLTAKEPGCAPKRYISWVAPTTFAPTWATPAPAQRTST